MAVVRLVAGQVLPHSPAPVNVELQQAIAPLGLRATYLRAT
jgi:hypothetical protein